jgi:uncharacterized protein YjiS (DUF1127 family)
MNKTTIVSAARAATSDTAAARPSGIFARMFAALSKARQMQADREVEIYLARQPDRMLSDIGMSESEIQDLRKKFDR